MNHLEPLCPNCNGYLASKIGSLEISCTSCDLDYQLIQKNKIERGLSSARKNMQIAKDADLKEYWCGFIGGIRWSLQKESMTQ